jgi:TolA-binding protein
MAGFGRIGRALSAAERADRNASREGVRPGSGKSGNRGDTPEFAERDRRAAAERAERRRNEEGARTTQRTSSITGAPVSMRDIQAAIRDRQQAIIDRQNELDMQRATARAGTSAGARRSTNKPENITLPSMREDAPDRAFSKGGMTKKKYNKGGYANCGASMKPDGKRRK